MYNINTSCYRFVVIDPNDTSSKTKINVMLDHDVGTGTFSNYQSILNSGTSSWTFSGTKRLIKESELITLFRFDTDDESANDNGPYIDNETIKPFSIKPKPGMYITNTKYYVNGVETNDHGYWTQTAYSSDNTYAFFLDEKGNNSLAKKTEVKGIRPVIELDKSLASKGSYKQTISLSSTNYVYKAVHHLNSSGNSKLYNTMQGFTMTDNYVVFYSDESTDDGKGILYWDKISSPNTTYMYPNYYYYAGGHGNGMTYNPSTREVVVVGDSGKVSKFIINGVKTPGTSNETDYENGSALNKNENVDFGSYTGIAYNKFTRSYVGSNGPRVYLLNSAESIQYSFETTSFGMNQGLEYRNGYVYRIQGDFNCPNTHQTWCLNPGYFAEVYVYNAKINQDGTPNERFGRIEKIYTVDTISALGEKLEIEDASFYDGKLYIGFHNHSEVTASPFKIFSINESSVMPSLELYYPSYSVSGEQLKVTFSAIYDEIYVSGWNISSDNKTVSRYYSKNAGSQSVTICDYYNNCVNKTYNVTDIYNELNPTISVTGVTVTPSSISLTVDGTRQLTADVQPSGATNKSVTWTSLNNSIATVSNGVVTGVSPGTTRIKVTTKDGGFTAYSDVTVSASTVPVTGVILNPTSYSMTVGATYSLTATVLPEGATYKGLTWESFDSSIATVSSTGVVTAVGVGTVDIKVTTNDGGFTAKSRITVTAATIPVTGVTVTPSSFSLTVGGTRQLSEDVRPSGATNKGVTWSSNNKNVATVSSTGVVTAVGVGTVDIKVTTNDGGFTAKSRITVTAATIPVTGVTVTPSSFSLTVGGTRQLSEDVRPSGATNKGVTWSSNNKNVATVSSTGVVTAVGVGTTKIIVTTNDGGFTATSTVTVTAAPVSVTGVTISPTSFNLTVDKTRTLTAMVKPSGATNTGKTWTSSNEDVAKVSSTGVVTAIGVGTAEITVKTNDGGYTAKSIVTVTDAKIYVNNITLSDSSLILLKGSTKEVTATVSPSNATNKDVVWSSSNSSVATVSSTGVVTAVDAGNAVIYVKSADQHYVKKLYVRVYLDAAGIYLDQNSVNMPVNSESHLSYYIHTTTSGIVGDNIAQASGVTWSSSNPSVASISQEGVISSYEVGETKITVQDSSGAKDTCVVTVASKVNKITFEKDRVVLGIGASEKLKYTLSPADALEFEGVWASSDDDIVTVNSDGEITGISIGTAAVSLVALDGSISSSIDVVVVKPIENIILKDNSLINGSTINLGTKTQLLIVIDPDDATERIVSWQSSNPTVMSVDDDGNIVALSSGEATISVITESGKIINIITLSVEGKGEIDNPITGLKYPIIFVIVLLFILVITLKLSQKYKMFKKV